MHAPLPWAATLPAIEATYPGTPDQISAVRASLRGLLGGCPIADDIILCGSELASNAVIHSRSRLPDGLFTVRTAIYWGVYVWIEVEDEGGCWIDDPVPDLDRGHGHGLDIVHELATDWGIDGDPSGRVVWARIDWPAASALRSAPRPMCGAGARCDRAVRDEVTNPRSQSPGRSRSCRRRRAR